jgi:hypothetical protein
MYSQQFYQLNSQHTPFIKLICSPIKLLPPWLFLLKFFMHFLFFFFMPFQKKLCSFSFLFILLESFLAFDVSLQHSMFPSSHFFPYYNKFFIYDMLTSNNWISNKTGFGDLDVFGHHLYIFSPYMALFINSLICYKSKAYFIIWTIFSWVKSWRWVTLLLVLWEKKLYFHKLFNFQHIKVFFLFRISLYSKNKTCEELC